MRRRGLADTSFVVDNDLEPTRRITYSRRRGGYVYDIDMYEPAPASAGRFFAVMANMVRVASGEIVAINAELPSVYGATRDDAFTAIEAAVDAWVKNQTGANLTGEAVRSCGGLRLI
jgi:hypothetical protein